MSRFGDLSGDQVAAMVERIIEAINPGAEATPHDLGLRHLPPVLRRLPLAELATPLPRPTMYYGMGALDGSGRICNRAALDALGWQAGDRVEVTVRAGSIVVSPSPEGLFEIWGWGARTYVTVPLSARRLLGLAPGDQVLLVASPHHHRLLIHTVPGLDRMLSEQHEHLLGGAS